MRLKNMLALGSTLGLLLSACATGASAPPASVPATAPPATGGSAPPTVAPSVAPTPPPEATVRFRYSWVVSSDWISTLAAAEQGYFAANGIKFEPTIGTGSTDSVTLTGAGQHEIAVATSLAVVTGVGNEIPVKSVAALYQTDADGIISRPDTPIRTADDLIGKKMGIAPGSSTLMWQAIVALSGIDRTKVTEVPIGFGIEPLLTKQVDGLIDFGDGALIEARDALGEDAVWAGVGDFGVKPYGSTIIVNTDWAADNGDVVRRFLSAYAQGLKWAVENREAAIDLLHTQVPEESRESVADRMEAFLGYTTNEDTAEHGLLWMDETRWQTNIIDLARQIELTSRDLAVEDVMTLEYLPDPPVMANP